MIDFLLNYLPAIAGVLLGICYLPQILHTIRTKNVEGMSLKFWSILNVAISMLVVNGIVIYLEHGTWGYLLTEVFNLVLSLTMLVLVLKFRNKVEG